MKAESQEKKSFDMKGIWQRIKKPLLIAFFVLIVLIVLVSYCAYAENAGIFPGGLLNRLAVTDYLDSHYPGSSFAVSFKEYDQVRGRYVYACTGDAGDFTMAAKDFEVLEDGYFRTYLCDAALSEAAGDVLKAALETRWETLSGSKITSAVSVAVPNSEKGTEQTPADLLVTYGGSVQVTATIRGERIDYEAYTELVWQVLDTVRASMPKMRNDFIQVFYYRTDDNNPEGVLQYESHLQDYALMYTESGLKGAKNVHYYVELTDELQESLQWYTVIRVVVISVIGITVAGLGTLWLVRYSKKKKKYRKQPE